jgi:hypothetical protein
MKGFCAKQVNLHYGIEFHNAKYYEVTEVKPLLFIINRLSKIKKSVTHSLQSKPLICSREIADLSEVSQCNNAPRLPQTQTLHRFLQSAKTLQSRRLNKCLMALEFSHGMQS